MNRRPLKNYLRTHRKRLAFTQGELAELLGCRDGAKISRYECSKRPMPLETVIAYLVVFDVPVTDLFAGDYLEIRRRTAARARLLLVKLSRQPVTPLLERKIQFLRRIISEADAS